MPRARLLGLLPLFLLCAPGPARAASLDLDAWLKKPGVRLLAVEFYATWCEPCMEAVPRWAELHDKYERDGLRLVVVATRDPKGGCFNPGWNPDDVICDDDGRLADRFGASKSLPAAFLWSWQGKLLANHAHVDGVERAVRDYFVKAPRIDVEVEGVAAEARTSTHARQGRVRAERGGPPQGQGGGRAVGRGWRRRRAPPPRSPRRWPAPSWGAPTRSRWWPAP